MKKYLQKHWKRLMVSFCCLSLVTSVSIKAQNTIYVNDGKIYSACNEEIVMRGFNEMFVWSAYDRTGVTILPELKKNRFECGSFGLGY